MSNNFYYLVYESYPYEGDSVHSSKLLTSMQDAVELRDRLNIDSEGYSYWSIAIFNLSKGNEVIGNIENES